MDRIRLRRIVSCLPSCVRTTTASGRDSTSSPTVADPSVETTLVHADFWQPEAAIKSTRDNARSTRQSSMRIESKAWHVV